MGRILTRPSPARLIAVTVFALIAGGTLFYPAFVMQWYEGLLPFSPYRSKPVQQPPKGGWPKVDISKEQYVLAWPKGDSETSAPPLSLRILPTDWYAWWSLESKHETDAMPDGPEEIYLEVSIPNAEAILPETMEPLCQLAVEPAGGCAGARARVNVDRDSGELDVLLGKQPPQERTRVTNDGRNVPVIHEFWSRREAGRERFLGWACPSGPKDAPLNPVSGGRPEVLYQCFEPTGWFERKWPGWFGYEKRNVYTQCLRNACEMLFLFAGRQVTVEFELLPARDIETARFRLLLSVWEMLNRQRRDADQVIPPEQELAEARVQLAMCESLAEQLAKFSREQLQRVSEVQRHRMSDLRISCERAAQIGTRMVKASPSEAEPLLGRALRALARMDAIRTNGQELFDAWFAALAAKGRGESVEALDAGLLYLRAGPHPGKDDPKRELRDARVSATRALLTRFGRVLPDERRAEAYRIFEDAYYGDEHQLDRIALLKEFAALTAQQHGESSREVLQPLAKLVAAQSLAGDLDGLRETLARLKVAWFTQAAVPGAVPEPKDKEVIANSGLYLVYGLRLIAFRDEKHAEIAPQIDKVLETMRALLGGNDPFVRGAEFHQREVLTRNFVPSLPGGGMYGTPHY